MSITIKDVSRLSGASTAAVSLVLNQKAQGRVSSLKKQAILDVARKYNYRPNSFAKSLKLNKSFKVAVCIAGSLSNYPIMGCYSHYLMISRLTRQLHLSGYGIDLVQIDGRLSLKQIADDLLKNNAEGFIFLNWTADRLSKLMLLLERRRIPAVSIGTELSNGSAWVIYDRGKSFQNGAAYLLDQGLKKVAMLNTDGISPYTEAMIQGYQLAVRERGLVPYPPVHIHRNTAKAAIEAAQELLASVPDLEGILLTDNGYAPYLVHVLEPHKLRILGFGDEAFAEMCEPRLSYMRFPFEVVVESGANILLNQMRPSQPPRPCQQRHLCQLIVQDT